MNFSRMVARARSIQMRWQPVVSSTSAMMPTVARPRIEYFCTFGDVYFLHHVH